MRDSGLSQGGEAGPSPQRIMKRRGVRRRAWLLLLTVALAGLGFRYDAHSANPADITRPARVQPEISAGSDPSAPFFERGGLARLRIEVTGTNLTALRDRPRDYVRARVTDGITVYEDVGIHLKGARGSYRGFDDRPALTLDFNRYRRGQEFHGLKKIHLNNSVQDPTYLTEHVCGGIFRDAGIPTPRAGWAWLTVNGEDRGLYLLKEGFDRGFLRRNFARSEGNLYDGEFLQEITEPLKRDSGDGPDDRSDLAGLVAAATEHDLEKRWERLAERVHLDHFIHYMALDVLMWDWDGYVIKHNNYRVYFDPPGHKAVFLPHGMDQMLWEPDETLYPYMNGLVANAVLETSPGLDRYRAALRELLRTSFTPSNLSNRVHKAYALFRPFLAESSSRDLRSQDRLTEELARRSSLRASRAREQLESEPNVPEFDAAGASRPPELRPSDGGTVATLERETTGDRTAYLIRLQERGRASWRTRVSLTRGRYRLEAAVRTARVEVHPAQRNEGAGIRLSGGVWTSGSWVTSADAWTPVVQDFEVDAPLAQVEIVAELRAMSGEAWFDENSFRIRRR